MTRKICFLCVLCFALSLATPVFAHVQISLNPVDPVVEVGEMVDVDIVATFSDPVMAWGLDMSLSEPDLGFWVNLMINPAWDFCSTLDGDGLAGMTFPIGYAGEIQLATLTFEAGMTPGIADVMFSFGPEEDEGFLLESGFMDENVQFTPCTITVIPEPATFAVLLLSVTGVLCRRR